MSEAPALESTSTALPKNSIYAVKRPYSHDEMAQCFNFHQYILSLKTTYNEPLFIVVGRTEPRFIRRKLGCFLKLIRANHSPPLLHPEVNTAARAGLSCEILVLVSGRHLKKRKDYSLLSPFAVSKRILCPILLLVLLSLIDSTILL